MTPPEALRSPLAAFGLFSRTDGLAHSDGALHGARVLTVPGDPMAMPRPRARVIARPGRKPFAQIYVPTKATERMAEFGNAWRGAGYAKLDAELLDARMLFVFARPASHMGTGRNAEIVKPQYLGARPIATRSVGDLDNLAKLVLDGLTAVAYEDDARIVHLEVEKAFVDQAGSPGPETIVEIRPA